MIEQVEKRLLEILNGVDVAASIRAAELLMQLEANLNYRKTVGL